MKRSLLILLIGLGSFLMFSCYPDDANNVSDYDVAMTNYDKGFDFKSLSTFAINDTIKIISDGRTDTKVSIDTAGMIQFITKQFESLGYTLQPESAKAATTASTDSKPTFLVTVSIVQAKNFAYYYDNWGNYWNNWLGGWFGGPGSWYPYYSWYPVGVYSYQTGSLVMDMISTVERADNKVNMLWTGVVNGILTGDTSYDTQRYDTGIKKCFEQSPYLKK
ncbi:MAG: DUF4136 domain-containing protein [Marinifilaceae bacterium]